MILLAFCLGNLWVAFDVLPWKCWSHSIAVYPIWSTTVSTDFSKFGRFCIFFIILCVISTFRASHCHWSKLVQIIIILIFLFSFTTTLKFPNDQWTNTYRTHERFTQNFDWIWTTLDLSSHLDLSIWTHAPPSPDYSMKKLSIYYDLCASSTHPPTKPKNILVSSQHPSLFSLKKSYKTSLLSSRWFDRWKSQGQKYGFWFICRFITV